MAKLYQLLLEPNNYNQITKNLLIKSDFKMDNLKYSGDLLLNPSLADQISLGESNLSAKDRFVLKANCHGIYSNTKDVLNNSKQYRDIFNNSSNEQFGSNRIISTLSQIINRVIEAKYFEQSPSDFVTVEVGMGAWMDEFVTYKSFVTGDDFFNGKIKLGQQSRMPQASIALDDIRQKIMVWAMEIQYSIPEIKQLSIAGSAGFNAITAKQQALKKLHDLGLQIVAFKGDPGDSNFEGLYDLNTSGILTNTTLITEPLSQASDANFETVISSLIEIYRQNNERTDYPTHFAIPESDYNALVGKNVSSSFPIGPTRMERLKSALDNAVPNGKVEVVPSGYGDSAFNELSKQRYILYNKKETVMRIPVPYTSQVADTANQFQFTGVSYSSYTGVQLERPKSLIYFDYAV
jgi:hypothetical protein